MPNLALLGCILVISVCSMFAAFGALFCVNKISKLAV